jgi:hypothetical protein
VTNLDVGGTLYDVLFGDGMVGTVYAGIIFDAARETEARSVSTALEAFFNDGPILGTDIFGYGNTLACQVFLAANESTTGTQLGGPDSPLWFAPSGPPAAWGGQSPILFKTEDSTDNNSLTLATYALTPSSGVPAPATLALFGLGPRWPWLVKTQESVNRAPDVPPPHDGGERWWASMSNTPAREWPILTAFRAHTGYSLFPGWGYVV